MRLLFVSHSLPPADAPASNVGGMQRVASELHEAMRRRSDLQYNALVLRSEWSSLYRKMPAYLVRTARSVQRLAERQEVDVVLFGSMVTASLSVPLRKTLNRRGVRTAAIVHGLDVTHNVRLYQRFVPRVFDALDLVLPVSRATAQACMDRGAERSRIRVVPNGIDVSRFRPRNHRLNGERKRLSAISQNGRIPDDAFVVCSVGRQVPRKGFAWFAERVLPLMPENVHYVLAGTGPERETIEQAAVRRGLAHRVHLLGKVSEDDLALLYAASDVFVMPNIPIEGDIEGFGVVMLEAGLSGLPTVASRLDGIQDVIRDGVNGVLVESENPLAFAESLRHFYDGHEDLRAVSASAAAYTARTFSWNGVAERHVEILRDLVHEPRARQRSLRRKPSLEPAA